MIAMAWGCESQTRALGRRALAFYGGEAKHDTCRDRRRRQEPGQGAQHALDRAQRRARVLGRHPGRVRRLRQSRPPLDGPHLARRAGITRRPVPRDRNGGVGRPAVAVRPDTARNARVTLLIGQADEHRDARDGGRTGRSRGSGEAIQRSQRHAPVISPAPKQFVGTRREVGRQDGFRWSSVISLSASPTVAVISEPVEIRIGLTARREEVFVGICRVRPATVPVEPRRSTAVGPRSRACVQASRGIPGA